MDSEGDGPPTWRREEAHEPESFQLTSQRRQATVFDAVAGKLTNRHGRLEGDAPATQTLYSTKEVPFGPDEVLFRRKEAPQRYEEYDIYKSHVRDLPRAGQGVLPESDLLKAIHSYTSRCYGSLHRQASEEDTLDVNERSMDETALLAFGILLEEASREVLGRHGDLVFTEGLDGGEEGAAPSDAVTGRFVVPSGAGDQESGAGAPSRKRRRVAKSEEDSHDM
ncbi:unnamed protein product [Clonostachys byssicola]|uniref:Uncharacterized protein n=1 Tax=Clonostachys byssicola TaxID=160290 RepID=A0A9N9UVF1_9HYPO|nr:unnamed protein product [Clonostachys byssicola]